MVKVSVVVPIYNIEEELLRKCICSILNQSEKNIEIFLIDDGSTNNSLEVCNSFTTDSRVSVIHQKNSGVSVARNMGLERACGEWTMFVDPDDYLEPDCLEILLSKAQPDDDIVQNSSYYYASNKGTAFFFNNDRLFEEKNKIDLFYKLLSYSNPYKTEGNNTPCGIGAPWGKIFRTNFLRTNNITFAPELRRAQDIVFNLYAVLYAKQVRYINIPLYNYNYNHLGTMHSKYNPQLYEYYIRYAKARYDWYKNANLDDAVKDVFFLGSFFVMLFVLKNGPMHPLYSKTANYMKSECDDLMNLECFSWLKEYKLKTNIKVTAMSKTVQFLIKNRLWQLMRVLLLIRHPQK